MVRSLLEKGEEYNPRPSFQPLPAKPGVRVFDPVQNVKFDLLTLNSVEIISIGTEEMNSPVDTAVKFEAEQITFQGLSNVIVRTPSMEVRKVNQESQGFEKGKYELELSGTPMKIYFQIEGEFEIKHTREEVFIEFCSKAKIKVGARSFHDLPEGTIKITDDIDDLMAAISHFGSALKTKSSERSFPTLRGHPPLIEFGNEFSVPGNIALPETDIQIVLPPEREKIFAAAPLAFYLGAQLKAGRRPYLVVEGEKYPLDDSGTYNENVNQMLQRVVSLDCLTRTEGYYPVSLHARNQLQNELALDFKRLYGRSIAKRLKTYLNIDFEKIKPIFGEWHQTVDIAAEQKYAEILPFVVDNLAFIRSPVEYKYRNQPSNPDISHEPKPVFEASETQSFNHSVVDEGYPIGAHKMMKAPFYRQLQRFSSDEAPIEVHVVCNDPHMTDEGMVTDIYHEVRDELNLNPCLHPGLDRQGLKDLLTTSSGFLHYIGHVEQDGIDCFNEQGDDESLDVRKLESVSIQSFVLNGCESFAQGHALIRQGSHGGVVTLDEIKNPIATEVGRDLAQYLGSGFPLHTALKIATSQTRSRGWYTTLGDGGLSLVQPKSGSPAYVKIRKKSNNRYSVKLFSYPGPGYGPGSMFLPALTNDQTRYLISGELETVVMTGEELDEYLEDAIIPVEFRGKLFWSTKISSDDL